MEQILGIHPSSRRITPLGRMHGGLARLQMEKGTEGERIEKVDRKRFVKEASRT